MRSALHEILLYSTLYLGISQPWLGSGDQTGGQDVGQVLKDRMSWVIVVQYGLQ